MGATFKIEGADEIQSALLALPEKVAKGMMKGALEAGAEIVLEEAKKNAPVKSGDLRDGLEIANEKGAVVVQTGQGNKTVQRALRKIANKARRNAGGVDAGRKAAHDIYAKAREKVKANKSLEYQGQYYGNMQECGTKKMPAHPFMGRALETKSEEATEAIAAKLKEGIEEQAFKG